MKRRTKPSCAGGPSPRLDEDARRSRPSARAGPRRNGTGTPQPGLARASDERCEGSKNCSTRALTARWPPEGGTHAPAATGLGLERRRRTSEGAQIRARAARAREAEQAAERERPSGRGRAAQPRTGGEPARRLSPDSAAAAVVLVLMLVAVAAAWRAVNQQRATEGPREPGRNRGPSTRTRPDRRGRSLPGSRDPFGTRGSVLAERPASLDLFPLAAAEGRPAHAGGSRSGPLQSRRPTLFWSLPKTGPGLGCGVRTQLIDLAHQNDVLTAEFPRRCLAAIGSRDRRARVWNVAHASSYG